VILGTAGHIDHGKTTLVRALTGVDTDRLPEEKRRGITIELGFAPLVLDGIGTVGVVDVPGHEAFVRTMVAGATGIDLALLVVAADEGVMLQTREHLAILELLGVRRGVVALTKADMVDDEWLALVEEDVRGAIARALPDAPIVATSTVSGRGLDELRAALADVARAVPARGSADLFRLPIDRVFSIKGTGTVVTGTVWSGRLTRDETVRILPGDRIARVRAIQGHGSQLDAAVPGARTAIALANVDVPDVPRGATLVTERDWRTTTMIRADIALVPGADVAIRPRTWHRFHVGTSEVGGRIVARAGDISDSEPFAARVVLDHPVVVRAGDRFVVRTPAPLNTIAGGVVTDPYPPRRARVWPVGLDVGERLRRLVAEAAGAGMELSVLPVRLGLSAGRGRELVDAATDEMLVVAGLAVSREVFGELGNRLVAITMEYHMEHPLEPGIPAGLLRSRVLAAEEVVEAALQGTLVALRLAAVSGAISVAGWVSVPSPEQASLLQTIVSQLEQAGAEPPTVEELGGPSSADTAGLLRYLERRGDVVQVEQNRYYATSQLQLLVGRLRAAMGGGSTELNPSQLREVLGLSRKFLIPFLEYCDRVGHTSRSVTGRVWRGA
jgi:selenocysteine-specific elongation factor